MKIVHVESSIKNLEDLVKGCDFAVPIGKESYDFSRMIPKVLYDTDGVFYNKDTGALYYVSESEITLPRRRKKENNMAREIIVKEDEKEFIGQIIDIFEDFLEDNGIEIPNSEREDENNSAIIYGSDYGRLQEDLEKCMKAWGVIK